MQDPAATPDPAIGDSNSELAEARRRWLAVLAKAAVADLEAGWEALAARPRYRVLRPAETGLVMVRGRIGGSGAPFNLGEMTMTRAAVQLLDDGGEPVATGFGHVAGRAERKAELVALFDAMLQDPRWAEALGADLIARLAARQAAAQAEAVARVMASKVEFFTMVRSE